MSFFGNFREKLGSLPYRRGSQWDVPKSNPSALQVPQWKSDGTMDWKTLAPVDIGFPTPQPFPGFFYIDFTGSLTTFGNGAANLVLTGQGTTSDPTWVSPFDATAPTTSAVGDAAAAGSATTSAHRDHRHGREAFGSVVAGTTYGAASADGTALTVSHSDHNHGAVAHDTFPNVVMANTNDTTWTPGFTGFATPPTTAAATYQKFGGMVAVSFVQNALGTSNANTFTITGLPFAPANAITRALLPSACADGGANVAAPIWYDIASTTMTLFLNVSSAVTWNATATSKGCYGFTIWYPYA